MTRRKFWRYKSRKLKHFWVDYFKAYIEYNYTPKLFKLWLSANSNIFFTDDDTYIELMPQEDYKLFEKYYVLKDKETNVSLWFIMIPKIKKVWSINYNNIFEVTWQGLILRDLKFYFDFIKWAWFKIDKFKRVDLCFDLENETDYIYKEVLAPYLEWKTVTPIIKKGVLETLYIWNRNEKANTYQLIRIYNKILDTKRKRKTFLYDFKGLDSLTRFEVEIRRDKACFLTEKKLLDDDYIFSVIVKTFYKMNYQFFKFLQLEDFKKVKLTNENLKLKRKKAIIDRQDRFIKYWNDFLNDTEEQRTIKLFINSAKRLFKNWYSRKKIDKLLTLYDII